MEGDDGADGGTPVTPVTPRYDEEGRAHFPTGLGARDTGASESVEDSSRVCIDLIDVSTRGGDREDDDDDDDTDSAIHQVDSPVDPHLIDLSDSKPFTSEEEEQFESYGENDDETDSHPSIPQVEEGEAGGYLYIQTQPGLVHNRKTGKQRRDIITSNVSRDLTWPRSRRTRCSLSNRKLSSNALASHLYNVSNSTSPAASDDMFAEEIAEDVYDLNGKVVQLQEQVAMLAQTQLSSNDKQIKLKQDNAALTERVHMLEEQVRDAEYRGDRRVSEEQKRAQEMLSRLDKEKSLEIESLHYQLRDAENKYSSYLEEMPRLKNLVERLKQEKSSYQEGLSDAEHKVRHLEEDNSSLSERCRSLQHELDVTNKSHGELLDEVTKEIDDLKKHKAEHDGLRSRAPSLLEYPGRMHDMEKQVQALQRENTSLKEQNDELQAQILTLSVQEGFRFLHTIPSGISLADELNHLSRDDVMQRLYEQQEINKQLKQYIDEMLLNVIDSNPGILEIKK